jgi:putative ABC transport system permease protein
MEEIFGISMDVLMYVFLVAFLLTIATVIVLALRNRIILKLALRNIPRRRGQTVLIIVGVMLSTVIMAAAFGTGDTLSFSIRNEAVKGLGLVDELIIPLRADEGGSISRLYFPVARFDELQVSMAANEDIDGLTPQLAETVAVRDTRTKLSAGQTRLVGLDPGLLDGFGGFAPVGGGVSRIADLADGEVLISTEAQEELDAEVGDTLDMFLEDRSEAFTVVGIVERGGLAGVDPTVLMPLSRAQALFGREGEINSILVSNRGDERGGEALTEDVTRELRSLFNDQTVAVQLKELFNSPKVLEVLEEKRSDDGLGADLKEKLDDLLRELKKPGVSAEWNSLLVEKDLGQLVLSELGDAELRELVREAATLYLEVAEFRVITVKEDLLKVADEAGTAVTSIFILFSSFSITVGILLIFLIFVMLAAARKYEMGMARAVGARRRHLILMFVFEGTAYAVVAAAVGVVLGLVVSAVMITALNEIFSTVGEDFQLTIHFEPRSVIVTYCLGMMIAFATVAVSAYRVSRLNIVVAIRGLPETIIPKEAAPFLGRLLALGKSLVLPAFLLVRGVVRLVQRRPSRAVRDFLMAIVAVPAWPVAIFVGVLRFVQPYLIQGWLTLLAGVAITYFAITSWGRFSFFGGGVTLSLLGLGLLGRSWLRRTAMPDAMADRVASTVAGVLMLAFWVLPFSVFESFAEDLERGFDIMFFSGVAMVGAAVWTVMYNADLLLKGLSLVAGRAGRLRPVLVTAVAYPMAAKFRTGLTLAMFALVIFTLMVMSVLSETFSTQFEAPRKVYAGFDVSGEVNVATPINDMAQAIRDLDDVKPEDFDAIGGYASLVMQLRAVEGENDIWHGRRAIMADDAFLEASEFEMKIVAEGYGPTAEDVMLAMREDPSLVIVGGWMISTQEPTEEEAKDSPFGGLYYEAAKMKPVKLEMRERRTGEIIPVTVIGVFDKLHRNAGRMVGAKSVFDDVLPVEVPVTHYRFRLGDGVDAKSVARGLEAGLLEFGMETEVYAEVLEEESSAGKAFFRLFTGFMALGLLVGVAALGVVSTRAVVERRQQIGVLRAIGYKRRMVQLSFLMEASFVSVLGCGIGLVLGLVLSYNAVSDIRREEGIDAIRFTIPWLQIGVILAVTYLFSLLTTFLPARQASKIYPAEALRYE